MSEAKSTVVEMPAAKSVLVMLTLDGDCLMVNAPEKPPRMIRTMDELHRFIRDPGLSAAKALPGFSFNDVISGIGRTFAELGKPEGEGK